MSAAADNTESLRDEFSEETMRRHLEAVTVAPEPQRIVFDRPIIKTESHSWRPAAAEEDDQGWWFQDDFADGVRIVHVPHHAVEYVALLPEDSE